MEKERSAVGQFFADHPKAKWLVAILLILAIIGYFVIGARNGAIEASRGGGEATPSASAEPSDAADPAVIDDGEVTEGVNGGTDKLLASMQEDLKEEYGEPPEGFVWDQFGNPVSLGIAGMESEDVVYTYLRSVSTLDMGMAQKLSRESTVLETYGTYFNSKNVATADSETDFEKNVYRLAMLSLANDGIQDSSVFAANQRAYTVNATMLDLTDKSFWLADKDKLFAQIYEYEEVQNDSKKAEQYINDYILNHYESGKAKTRKVSFTLTVQKYPDLNSGWLVSIDKDLDTLLSGKDANSLNQNIMSEYNNYKRERIQSEGGN